MNGVRFSANGEKIIIEAAGCDGDPINLEVSLSSNGKVLTIDPIDGQTWTCTIRIKRIQRMMRMVDRIIGRREFMEADPADRVAMRSAERASRIEHVRPMTSRPLAPEDL